MSRPNKAAFSRRRFCALLAATPFAGGTAQASPMVAGPKASAPKDAAAVLHTQATQLLRKGLRFERAAEYLILAAEKDPANPAHPLALGCALASRAVSLAYAAGVTNLLEEERENFPRDLREWEQEREYLRAKDPQTFDTAGYQKTRPTLPPLREFRIKDDNQPFRLTAKQSEKRLNEFVAGARAAWVKGLALSTTPEEKARAYYVQSWGMHLLRVYLVVPEIEGVAGLPFVLRKIPTKAQVVEAAEKATIEATDNSLYWQALGDALEEGDEAVKAYARAAELKPRDANLSYLLYTRLAGGASSPAKEQWPLALQYLQRAQARDKGNAWPLYEEAAMLFRYAPYSLTGPSGNPNASDAEKEVLRKAVRTDEARRNGRLAIDRIVSGNGAPRYDAPRYRTSVPDLLWAAWNYRFPYSVNYESFARLRELARSAAGYAQIMAEFENNPEEAERAAWAVVSLGYRMIGDWPVKDDFRAGKTVIQVLVGTTIASAGYTVVNKVYATLENTEKQVAAQAESDKFKERVTAYRKVATDFLNRSEYEYY